MEGTKSGIRKKIKVRCIELTKEKDLKKSELYICWKAKENCMGTMVEWTCPRLFYKGDLYINYY